MSNRDRRQVTSHAVEQEIKNEQAVVDRIYARLEAAAASARQLAADGHARARLGNFGGLVERDAIVFQAGRRLASLDAAHDGLVFGRLDLHDGETRYVGRLGLRNADRDVCSSTGAPRPRRSSTRRPRRTRRASSGAGCSSRSPTG